MSDDPHRTSDGPAPSIKCPVCGARSHNPGDIEHGFCGRCDDYTANPDGCVRAYLRARSVEPTVTLVMAVLKGWFAEREPGAGIMDWLPANWRRYNRA